MRYETYEDMMCAHQREINRFPIGFAFGDAQFEEMMKRWGFCNGADGKPTAEDLRNIVSISNGGYIRVQDIEAFHELVGRHQRETEEFQSSRENLTNQILYELRNHEYSINDQGDFDVCSALGREEKDIEEDDFFGSCYKEAVSLYWNDIYAEAM